MNDRSGRWKTESDNLDLKMDTYLNCEVKVQLEADTFVERLKDTVLKRAIKTFLFQFRIISSNYFLISAQLL